MSINPGESYKNIVRRKSKEISVGDVKIGGGNTIKVQSMTNTATTDIVATVAQIKECIKYGADLMRVSVPDEDSSAALGEIIKQVPEIPIVADIHFHYKRAIESAKAGAKCLRINPGNIGNNERVKEVVKAAKDYGCAIRIGVNAGSLEKEILEKYKEPTPAALTESALNHIKILEDNDFFEIKVSVKASNVFLATESYKQLANSCEYPLHIGITEAGGMIPGTVKSAIGLGNLLWNGIGDTIRVSLSAPPVEEIKVAYEMLKALDLRHRGVNIISCPSCARQQFPVVKVVAELEQKLAHITTPMDISVIGCVVNGPGEASHTTIGLTGGGNGNHLVYFDGKPHHKVKSEDLVDHLVSLIEEKSLSIKDNMSKINKS